MRKLLICASLAFCLCLASLAVCQAEPWPVGGGETILQGTPGHYYDEDGLLWYKLYLDRPGPNGETELWLGPSYDFGDSVRACLDRRIQQQKSVTLSTRLRPSSDGWFVYGERTRCLDGGAPPQYVPRTPGQFGPAPGQFNQPNMSRVDN